MMKSAEDRPALGSSRAVGACNGYAQAATRDALPASVAIGWRPASWPKRLSFEPQAPLVCGRAPVSLPIKPSECIGGAGRPEARWSRLGQSRAQAGL